MTFCPVIPWEWRASDEQYLKEGTRDEAVAWVASSADVLLACHTILYGSDIYQFKSQSL